MKIFKTYKITFSLTDEDLFILLHQHLLNLKIQNKLDQTKIKPSRKSFREYVSVELYASGVSNFDDYIDPEEGSETWNEANRLFFIWFRKPKNEPIRRQPIQ